MNSNDVIANALDMAPLEIVPAPVRTSAAAEQIQDDFEYARANMVATLSKATEALDGMLEVAQQSQHPRAYEVVATLVKTIADVNKDLMELSKRRQDLTGERQQPPQAVTNNLFVGSTAELQKLIRTQNGSS
jgi:Terminase DNA packaging enzyme